MQVVVKKRVHIRSATPFRKQNNKKGLLYAGHTVQVAKKVTGQLIEDNDIWYQDLNGDYLWSGGFAPFKESSAITSIQYYDYNTLLLDIPEEIKDHYGAGIRIGIMDWGFDLSHPSVLHLKKDGRMYDMNKEKSEGNDELKTGNGHDSHGVECISLIAARPTEDGSIKGLAPDADVYFFKVKEGDPTSYLKAFQKAGELDLHILFTSTSVEYKPNENQFLNALKRKNINGHCIIVATTRNGLHLSTLDSPKFPANLAFCLSVGGVNNYQKSDHQFQKLDYLFYSKNDLFCIGSKNIKKQSMSSSYATALFAGLLGKYLASKRDMRNTELKITGDQIRDFIFNNWRSFHENKAYFPELNAFQIKPSSTKKNHPAL